MKQSLWFAAPIAAAVLITGRGSAQNAPPAWHVLVQTADGTRLSVDSATVLRTSGATWRVRTGTWYPAPLAVEGGTVDREVDTEEVDCAAKRSRGIEAALYLGDDHQSTRALS